MLVPELALAVALTAGFPEKTPMIWIVVDEKAQYPAKGAETQHCACSASLSISETRLAAAKVLALTRDTKSLGGGSSAARLLADVTAAWLRKSVFCWIDRCSSRNWLTVLSVICRSRFAGVYSRPAGRLPTKSSRSRTSLA